MKSFGILDMLPRNEEVSLGDRIAIRSTNVLLTVMDALIKVADGVRAAIKKATESQEK